MVEVLVMRLFRPKVTRMPSQDWAGPTSFSDWTKEEIATMSKAIRAHGQPDSDRFRSIALVALNTLRGGSAVELVARAIEASRNPGLDPNRPVGSTHYMYGMPHWCVWVEYARPAVDSYRKIGGQAMKTFLLLVMGLTLFVMLYVVWLRERMTRSERGKRILARIEPLERILYWNSETMLWSRFKAAAGAVLTALIAIDWSSVSPVVPEKFRPWMLALPTLLMALDGLIGEWLRRGTTKPLEVVAMRTDAPVEVKALATEAAALNKAAVVAAKETGAV